MRKGNLHIAKILSGYLILALVTFMLFTKVFFVHSHISSSGEIFIHAHPFQKKSESKDNPHQHSDKELVYYAANETYDLASTTDFDFQQEVVCVPFKFNFDEQYLYKHTIKTKGRSPPFTA